MNTPITDNGLIITKENEYPFQNYRKYIISKLFDNNIENENDITTFQALNTSLATSIGTGCIVGSAIAISTGGPGSVFWMLLAILFGSTTKFAEALLSTKYSTSNISGEKSGGPMYYIRAGITELYGGNWSWLGWVFAFFGTISSFFIGNLIQANIISDSLLTSIKLSSDITGAVFTFIMALIVLGGIRTISKVSASLIPLMVIVYVGCSLFIIFRNISILPNAFLMIGSNIFSAKAVGGGLFGNVIRLGIFRGIIASEVGYGTSSIPYAASSNREPVLQGIISGVGSLTITIVMCLSTALVILLSGLVKLDSLTGLMTIEGGLNGSALTTTAFNSYLPGFGGAIVSTSLILFGVTTMIGWYYYGSKCLEYIAGVHSLEFYKWIWISLCFLGSIYHMKLIWDISGLVLTFMVIPNLLALFALSPVILTITKDYLVKKPDLVNRITG